jgi:hypothetical protein
MFSPGHFSSLSLEDIPPPLPPSPGDILMALPPPVIPKGGDKASRTLSKVVELLVFDILNIFCRRWFLSRSEFAYRSKLLRFAKRCPTWTRIVWMQLLMT